MHSEKELIRISKFLSLVLRHRPEAIGITLDENGWTDVTVLLEKMRVAGTAIDLVLLQEVVTSNTKQRFAFNDDNTRIRANQGHSVSVDLALEAKEPPAILYHGTSETNIPAILKEGLHKRNRHHVHLSGDHETAIAVGQRHGKPVVFTVAAQQMHKDGFTFFQSTNGVWLTEHVPPAYLMLIE
jgi:putative RNA 2'-phosphotransferase